LMFVCCDCCVLSGRDLCDGLITRPEESYRLWRVVVCVHETSKTRRISPLPGCENTTTLGCNAKKTTTTTYLIYNHNWRNISTIYIYSKSSIKRNILTIKQNTSGSR